MGKAQHRCGPYVGLLVGGCWAGLGALGCGGADRPDLAAGCDGDDCVPTVVVASTPPDGDGPAPGAGGVIEQAPPAGAPAEGLGVDVSLVGAGEIGVPPTVGVDGRQRVPPGVVEPGGAPPLPGPDDALNPPPGAAVDPVTGIEPPREGVGGVIPGTVAPPPLREAEPTEDSFTF